MTPLRMCKVLRAKGYVGIGDMRSDVQGYLTRLARCDLPRKAKACELIEGESGAFLHIGRGHGGGTIQVHRKGLASGRDVTPAVAGVTRGDEGVTHAE